MAYIDYGGLLRVREKDSKWRFVNKNCDLFMETSDTGYVCKSVMEKDGSRNNIAGNFYVCAGDEKLLLAFYKGMVKIISNREVLATFWNHPFVSEVHKDPDGRFPDIQISHLDPTLYTEKLESWGTWEEYVRENWIGATGKEPLWMLRNGEKTFKRFKKHLKRCARKSRSGAYKYRTHRFLAKWEYAGKEYEVLFGYGIDPEEKCWNRIKYETYDFTDIEREIIDTWFLEG